MNIVYTHPELKKNYYICKTNKNLFYDIINIKINKILKLKDGYLLYIYINDNEIKKTIHDIDNNAKDILINNNNIWFSNELAKDDIEKLFKPSICNQNNILNIYLTDKSNIYINNKLIELSDNITSLLNNKYINVRIQLIGLYIYSNQTYNKWHLHSIYLYEDDITLNENKIEIEEYWKETIEECYQILDNKIVNIQNTKLELENLYKAMINTEKNNIWDNKIYQIKKLVQNIIF